MATGTVPGGNAAQSFATPASIATEAVLYLVDSMGHGQAGILSRSWSAMGTGQRASTDSATSASEAFPAGGLSPGPSETCSGRCARASTTTCALTAGAATLPSS